MLRKRMLPTYKQMAFDTSVRNPERYKEILYAVKEFNGRMLNDECLKRIVTNLYLKGIVSSNGIEINEYSQMEDVMEKVVEINSTRNSDGGFPKGVGARFWTYMRTLSEMGIVYARYNQKFSLSEIAVMLLDGGIDEEEMFSVQAMKFNRKSPYRNVTNDYNYFKFIINVLLTKSNNQLSYNEFCFSLFSNDGNVKNFLEEVEKYEENLKNEHTTYLLIRDLYGATNKKNTIMNDYPDVVLRMLRITGFITVVYKNTLYLKLNSDKVGILTDFLKIPFNLSEKEKESPELFFNKMNTATELFLNIAKTKVIEDTKKEIAPLKLRKVIDTYNISYDNVIKWLSGKNEKLPYEFKYIPKSLLLEFYISMLIFLKYKGSYIVKPNYKFDEIGVPISHAPGNMGDIVVYGENFFWLVEVTLINNRNQQLNAETTTVIRHFRIHPDFKSFENSFLSFVAPSVHEDTRDYYKNSTLGLIIEHPHENIFISPYSITEFIKLVDQNLIFENMISNRKEIIKGLEAIIRI